MISAKRNKNILSLVIALTGAILITNSFAGSESSTHRRDGNATVNGVANCNGAHNQLKKILKDRSRDHCESSHGSKGGNKLRNENYTKSSCTAYQVSGTQNGGFDVVGVLSYNCKD